MNSPSLFHKENLHAWCIVPFDKLARGPASRAAMLRRLGLTRYAYDWRDEHVPTFDEEVEAARDAGLTINAWWFSNANANDDRGRKILEVVDRHGIHPQLWVTRSKIPLDPPEGTESTLESTSDNLLPTVEAAAERGLRVALYNHGGWFGEPENQIQLIERVKDKGFHNVGIVYNLHHGHSHLDRMEALIALMKPHLLAFNLNGMTDRGDQCGKKLLPLGQGDRDLDILGMLVRSGWQGPVGILNHTTEDAEARLRDNLEGLTWLVSKLEGNDTGPAPTPKSWTPNPVS